MTSYPHVALIVETSKQYDRGLLRGIGRYVKGHGPWSIYIEERGARDATPAWIRDWKGNGIIARIKDAAMAEALLATGVPIVELRAIVDLDLPDGLLRRHGHRRPGGPPLHGARVPAFRLLRPERDALERTPRARLSPAARGARS